MSNVNTLSKLLFYTVPFAYHRALKVLKNAHILADFESNDEYFKALCMEGFKSRFGDTPPEGYLERLEYENCKTSKGILTSLINSGATDELQGSRLAKTFALESLQKQGSFWAGIENSPQISLFQTDQSFCELTKIDLSDEREFDEQTLLKKEREAAGFFISGHPLGSYRDKLNCSERKLIGISELSHLHL